jgi:hypothetical protein
MKLWKANCVGDFTEGVSGLAVAKFVKSLRLQDRGGRSSRVMLEYMALRPQPGLSYE